MSDIPEDPIAEQGMELIEDLVEDGEPSTDQTPTFPEEEFDDEN